MTNNFTREEVRDLVRAYLGLPTTQDILLDKSYYDSVNRFGFDAVRLNHTQGVQYGTFSLSGTAGIDSNTLTTGAQDSGASITFGVQFDRINGISFITEGEVDLSVYEFVGDSNDGQELNYELGIGSVAEASFGANENGEFQVGGSIDLKKISGASIVS